MVVVLNKSDLKKKKKVDRLTQRAIEEGGGMRIPLTLVHLAT